MLKKYKYSSCTYVLNVVIKKIDIRRETLDLLFETLVPNKHK